MIFIYAVIGAVVGWLLYRPYSGMAFGAVIGCMVGLWWQLRDRVSRLENEVAALRLRDRQPAPEFTIEPPRPVVPPQQQSVPKPAQPASPLPNYPQQPPPRALAQPSQSHVVKESTPSPVVAKLQKFLSENLLVKAGVVILFFGVAFLLKYAAERSLFPIELRLAATGVGAIALITIGWRLRLYRSGYGLILQGGGIGILYLTLFASYRLYHLLPASLVLLVMVALCFSSALLALFQDSLALAVLGASGGFLAPLLCSTGQGSHVALFSYYALLNSGILFIAWKKAWRPLNLTGFIFTFAIGSIWGGKFYQPQHFASVEPFLILFFLMYVAVAVLFALRHPTQFKGVDGTLVFGTPIIAFSLQALMVKDYEYGMAFSALSVGIFYLILASIIYKLRPQIFYLLAESFLAFGFVFGTLTIPLAFDGRWTSAAWAVEGAAIIWLGVRLDRKLAQGFGSFLVFASGVAFLDDFPLVGNLIPVLNHACVGSFLIAVSAIIGARQLVLAADDDESWQRIVSIFIFIWGVIWWGAAGIREIDHFVLHDYQASSLVLFVVITAFVASFLSRRLEWNYPAFVSLLLLPAMVVITFAVLQDGDFLTAGGGWLVWPLAYGVHYLVVARHEDEVPPVVPYLHAGAIWLLALQLCYEWYQRVSDRVFLNDTWAVAATAIPVSLLLVFLSLPEERLRGPWRRQRHLYLTLGSIPLVLFFFVWSLFANIASNGDPAPIAYFPLLNPLDLAMFLGFLAVATWWFALPEQQGLRTSMAKGFAIAYFSTAFIAVNAILLRALHYYGDVPYRPDALLHSDLVQASLALFWTILATCAMVAATLRRSRSFWITGAGLLGIVVVKLFFIDLSQSGTMTRIVSFVGVGILLLLIGYLAPIPPEEHKGVTS